MSVSKLVLCALAALVLAACGKSGSTGAAVAPVEVREGTSCALDGMLLADYPGPKAQIHYAGQQMPDYFCDTVEMFNVFLSPEQVKVVRAIYVQDMGKTDWNNPVGQWIDAKQAFYVIGSKLHGSMGPTFASFAQQTDAARFAGENGGKVLRFGEVTPDMAVLDGGAQHEGGVM